MSELSREELLAPPPHLQGRRDCPPLPREDDPPLLLKFLPRDWERERGKFTREFDLLQNSDPRDCCPPAGGGGGGGWLLRWKKSDLPWRELRAF